MSKNNQPLVIETDEQFLAIVESRSFVTSNADQEALFAYAMKAMNIDHIIILWLIQQNHSVGFTHNILKDAFLEHATVDQILFALKNFLYKPTDFIDKVLASGNAHQINELNTIIEGLIDG